MGYTRPTPSEQWRLLETAVYGGMAASSGQEKWRAPPAVRAKAAQQMFLIVVSHISAKAYPLHGRVCPQSSKTISSRAGFLPCCSTDLADGYQNTSAVAC